MVDFECRARIPPLDGRRRSLRMRFWLLTENHIYLVLAGKVCLAADSYCGTHSVREW
jgi:hypothetical protein